jgi:hypothetical protein
MALVILDTCNICGQRGVMVHDERFCTDCQRAGLGPVRPSPPDVNADVARVITLVRSIEQAENGYRWSTANQFYEKLIGQLEKLNDEVEENGKHR